MTLEAVNEILQELANQFPLAIEKARGTEYEYEMRFFQLLLNSGMGNAQAREAEAKAICDTEGLYRPMIEAKGLVRTLYNQKECYIEIARNLRTMKGGD